MEKINCIIVEDEPLAAEVLNGELSLFREGIFHL